MFDKIVFDRPSERYFFGAVFPRLIVELLDSAFNFGHSLIYVWQSALQDAVNLDLPTKSDACVNVSRSLPNALPIQNPFDKTKGRKHSKRSSDKGHDQEIQSRHFLASNGSFGDRDFCRSGARSPRAPTERYASGQRSLAERQPR